MMRPSEHRRPYVKDPAMCKVCWHGQHGCKSQKHLGKGVCACIGYCPSVVRI